MMERAMAWLPCPVCGKEAEADVRATFLPENFIETDKEVVFVDAVLLRYKVKKHDGCELKCDIGRTYYIDTNRQFLKDGKLLMQVIMDDFQERMEKGEIEWNKE